MTDKSSNTRILFTITIRSAAVQIACRPFFRHWTKTRRASFSIWQL